MLNRFPQAKSYSIRPARAVDKDAINQLLDDNLQSHLHLDWRLVTDWLGLATSFVAEASGQLLAFLIAPADPPPVAWLRAAAVASGHSAKLLTRQLLDACLTDLAQRHISTLTAMPVEPWIAPVLDDLGFAIVEQVENWIKPDVRITRPGNPQVLIRPAVRDEMPTLAQIDQAAFNPRWWHSPETLILAWERATNFTVAELDGRPAGFQISLGYQGQAHLARITVHPAVQGQGIGSRLLAEALADYANLGLQQVSLNTQTDNLTSHQLYRAFGFERYGLPIPVWERPV